MRIVHISDLHIRNFKYYSEYQETFNNLFKQVKQQNPDIIVFTGDLFHSKVNITGVAISLAKEFLNGLADIAPLKIILGNHDLNLKNQKYISAVVPIVNMVNNVELYNESGFYEVSDNVVFALYSVINDGVLVYREEELDKNKIYIGLAHFCINGTSSDYQFIFDSKKTVNMFSGMDYVMLGDIHKRQSLDEEGRIRYAGSLLQNNFGEAVDNHGFLVWDIEDKENFNVEFHEVLSPLKFYTANLQKDNTLKDDFKPCKNAHIRLIIEHSITQNDLHDVKAKLVAEYTPVELRVVNNEDSNDSFNIANKNISPDNLRDSNVQSSFITDFLKDYNIDDETMKDILKISNELDAQLANENITRNIIWNIKKFEFSNYFNYGEDNVVDFNKLKNKVSLISGPNRIGKSGLFEAICHTLFNTIARDVNKNSLIINSRKDNMLGHLTVDIGDIEYNIIREVNRLGEYNSRTDLDFYAISDGTKITLNGEQRFDTEKKVRELFGTPEDFMLSSYAAQGNINMFVENGPTERKEVLMRFLDLYFLDEKFELIKELSREIKVALKKYDGIDFDSYIEDFEAKVKEIDIRINKLVEIREEKKKILSKIENSFTKEYAKVKDIEIIDIDDINLKINKLNKDKDNVTNSIGTSEAEIEELNNKSKKIDELLNKHNIDDITKRKEEYDILKQKSKSLVQIVKTKKEHMDGLFERTDVLNSVPCNSKYPECPLIRGAIESKEKIESLSIEVNELNKRICNNNNTILEFEEENIEKLYNNLIAIKNKKIEISTNIDRLKIQISNNNNLLFSVNSELFKLNDKKVKYEKNIEQEVENKNTLEKLNKMKININNIKNEIEDITNNISNEHKEIGRQQSQTDEWRKRKEENSIMLKKYQVFKYLYDCFGKNGITYKIMTQKLPQINKVINGLLEDIVSYKIIMRYDEKNNIALEIKYPNDIARPLSIASGMEKTMASIAIRAGLTLMSSLPRTSSIMIDEGFGTLDSEFQESVGNMLHKLKEYFDSVIIITHVDQLKDGVEKIIEIITDSEYNALIEVLN